MNDDSFGAAETRNNEDVQDAFKRGREEQETIEDQEMDYLTRKYTEQPNNMAVSGKLHKLVARTSSPNEFNVNDICQSLDIAIADQRNTVKQPRNNNLEK